MDKRTDDAEAFVRKVLKSLGQKTDDDTVRSVAEKVADTIPDQPARNAA